MEMLHLVEGPRAELEELKPPAKAEPFHREPLDFYDLCQRELEELLSTVSFSREVLGVMTEPTEAARGFPKIRRSRKKGGVTGPGRPGEGLPGVFARAGKEFCPHLQSLDRREIPLDSWREWLAIRGELRTEMFEEVVEVLSDIESRLQVDGKR
ncbi:MAG: hypothetical protein ACUVRX_08565 [Actinomycetota bacterium]